MLKSFSVSRKGIVQITATVYGGTLMVLERTPEATMLPPDWHERLRVRLREEIRAEGIPHRFSPVRSPVTYVDVSTCLPSHEKYELYKETLQGWIEQAVLRMMYGDEGYLRMVNTEVVTRAS